MPAGTGRPDTKKLRGLGVGKLMDQTRSVGRIANKLQSDIIKTKRPDVASKVRKMGKARGY